MRVFAVNQDEINWDQYVNDVNPHYIVNKNPQDRTYEFLKNFK